MFVSPELFYARGLKPPCNPMELYNCLSIKVIRQPICRHEQLSLSWISFSLKTLRLSPFGLAGSGFSLPGTSPVRKSANETASSGRLFERVARVKAAWVELSENVSDKSGCSSSCRQSLKGWAVQGRMPFRVRFCATFDTKSGFAVGLAWLWGTERSETILKKLWNGVA